MPDETVTITFVVPEGKESSFQSWLREATDNKDDLVLGFRSERNPDHRPALGRFADGMEKVLREHDHKKTWRVRPIEALVRLLELELEEFKVAYSHFEVKDARGELVDIANYALIVWDRLSMFDQDKTMKEQSNDG